MRLLSLLLALAAALASPARAGGPDGWTAAWASAQMVPASDQVVPHEWLEDATLRQVVRVGLPRRALRLRLSNAHGTAPLAIGAVTVARSADNRTRADRGGGRAAVRFGGRAATVIPAGAEVWSDPVDFAGHRRRRPRGLDPPARRADAADRPPRLARDDAISCTATRRLGRGPARRADRAALAGARRDRGRSRPRPRAVAVLGDSITDGFGVQPDTNLRWTDHLAARLRADPALAQVAVLNAGIGGNRLLLDGLGPNALARLERDVLSQPGVTHLIVLEGVNDLGMLTRDAPATPEQHAALVAQAIEALAADRAARAGARDHGDRRARSCRSAPRRSTTRPAETEADRQAINAWIRAPGNFDAVIPAG